MSQRHPLSQSARILRLLKNQGKATNRELNIICFRYSARLLELRNEGRDIVTNLIKPGLYEYIYKGHKDQEDN